MTYDTDWLNCEASDVAWCHREAKDHFQMYGKENYNLAVAYKEMAESWTKKTWETYERNTWGRGAK